MHVRNYFGEYCKKLFYRRLKIMKLNDILDNIDIKSAYIPDAIQDMTVKALCHNSKYATPNCVFFCRVGALADLSLIHI